MPWGPGADLAQALNQLGMLYEALLRLPEAERILLEALHLREQLFGSKDVRTAATLNNLGLVYKDLAQPRQAEESFQRAHDAYLATQGPNGLGVRASLRHLGNVAERASDIARAEQLYSQALRIRAESDAQTADPESHLESACVMCDLGKLFLHQGDARRAAPWIDSALEIYRKFLAPDHAETFAILFAKGRLELLQGRLGEGMRLVDQALRAEIGARGGDSPNVALAYFELGETHVRAGLLSEATDYFNRAIGIYSAVSAHRSSNLVRALSALACVQLQSGQYAEADVTLHECREHTRGIDKRSLAFLDCLRAEADYFSTLGDLQQFQICNTAALAVSEVLYGKTHRCHAVALENAAIAHYQTEQIDEAEKFLLQAMEIRENHGEQLSKDYAADLRRLGQILLRRREYASAMDAFNCGLDLARSLPGPPLAIIASLTHATAVCEIRLGRKTEARAHMEEAVRLTAQSEGPLSLNHCDALGDAALLHACTGDWAAALAAAEKSSGIAEHHLRRVFAWATDDQRLQFAAGIRSVNNRHLAVLLASGDTRAALELIFRRKGIVTDWSAAARAFEPLAADPDAAALLTRYRSLLREIAEAWQQRSPDNREGQTKMMHADLEREAIEHKLAQHSAAFAGHFNRAALTVEKIAQALPSAAVLVEFTRCLLCQAAGADLLSPDHYAAFVLSPNSLAFIDLGEAEPIDRQITQFLQNMRPGSTGLLRAASDQLYASLIEPLRPHLPAEGTLVLAPDSELNRIAFAALPDGQGGRLTDRYSIVHVLCGRDLLAWQAPSSAPHPNHLVIADPDFQAGADPQAAANPKPTHEFQQSFPRLPHSKREGEAVAAFLGPTARLFTGNQATKSVIEGAHNVAVIHLASHGFVLPDVESWQELFALGKPGRDNSLLRSGFALAGAQAWSEGRLTPGAETGIVTAFELAGFDLRGTELAVLSCCHSGVGEIRTGEGVYGLRRAFFSAGARSLLISLWSVDDYEAVNFMQAFYRHLRAGRGKAEACRLAQQEVRESAPHPFYWAPFILVGNTAPIWR